MLLYKIYTLTDPRDGSLFYVGASRKDDNKLISRHLSHANSGKRAELRSLDILPIVETIDIANTPEEAAMLEEYWFFQLRTWGYKLENHFKGTYIKYSYRSERFIIEKLSTSEIEQLKQVIQRYGGYIPMSRSTGISASTIKYVILRGHGVPETIAKVRNILNPAA